MDATYIFFAGRHQRRSCRQVVDCRRGCTHIEIAGIELAQRIVAYARIP
jgi:hypothetical protein